MVVMGLYARPSLFFSSDMDVDRAVVNAINRLGDVCQIFGC